MSTGEEDIAADDEITRIIDQETEDSSALVSENGVDGPELEDDDDEESKSAMALLGVDDNQDKHSLESRSSCISPASSHGGQYSVIITDFLLLSVGSNH